MITENFLQTEASHVTFSAADNNSNVSNTFTYLHYQFFHYDKQDLNFFTTKKIVRYKTIIITYCIDLNI